MSRVKLWIAVVLLLSSIAACALLPPEEEVPYEENDGVYSFDQNTVLESISEGNSDVFTPVPENFSSPIPSGANANPLSFGDLLVVSEAFHHMQWGEPMSAWNVFELQYQLDCERVNLGPSFLGVSLFTIRHLQERDVRFVHRILIGHPESTIYWAESERYPVSENWGAPKLTEINIEAARDALKTAEENGGYEARQAVYDDCVVYVMFAPYLSTTEWIVRYYRASDSSAEQPYLFEAYIDQKTGKLRIIP